MRPTCPIQLLALALKNAVVAQSGMALPSYFEESPPFAFVRAETVSTIPTFGMIAVHAKGLKVGREIVVD
jgi:hypothetical protein